MRICLKCQTFYDDESIRFCLRDGLPLAGVDQGSDIWTKGTEAVGKNRQRIRKETRRTRIKKTVTTTVTSVLVIMVVSVITLNSWVYTHSEDVARIKAETLAAPEPVPEPAAQPASPETAGVPSLPDTSEVTDSAAPETPGAPDQPKTPPVTAMSLPITPPDTSAPAVPSGKPRPGAPEIPHIPTLPESPATGPATGPPGPEVAQGLPCSMLGSQAEQANILGKFGAEWRVMVKNGNRMAKADAISHWRQKNPGIDEIIRNSSSAIVTNPTRESPQITVEINGSCRASVKIAATWAVSVRLNSGELSADVKRTSSLTCSKTKDSWACTY